MLPAHQANALIRRPGGYRAIDYIPSGTGMTIIHMVVMIATTMTFH